MTKDREVLLRGGHATKAALAIMAAVAQIAAANPSSDHSPTAQVNAVSAANAPATAVDAFHAALSKGDTRTALDLLAEDVLIFESGGVERNRAEYASHHLAADAAFSAAVRRTLVSRSHGDAGDAAWVTSVETVAGTYRGRAINLRSVETMILRRVAGKWRIGHIHWSSKDLVTK